SSLADGRTVLRSARAVADVPALPARRAPVLQRVYLGAGRGLREGEPGTLDGQPLRRREPPGVARDGTRRSGGAAYRRHLLLLSGRCRARGRARGIRRAHLTT